MNSMFVTTFYSYKGGVGRTLALVNTAFRLAQKGKTVFILDFDLEAPGVDSFRLVGGGQPQAGIVEYVSQFSTDRKVPDLSEYVSEVDPAMAAPGKVIVMGAGRKDRGYQVQLSRFDWKHFYRQTSGYLFVENLKGAIQARFRPDYLLVDSRTGLTDVAGICTLQLPDLVILLFNLNNQNIDGIAHIYRSIRFNKLNRNIQTLLAASPVPDVPVQVSLLKDRLEYAKVMIGDGPKVVIPFDTFMAFEERVIAREDEGSRLGKAYDRLADEIIRANQGDVLTLVREARELREQGNIGLAAIKYQEMVEAKPNDLEALVEYGLFMKMQNNTQEATKTFLKAHELRPGDQRVLYNLATSYLASGQLAESKKFLRTFLNANPKALEVHSIGKVFEKAGLIEEAMEAYETGNRISEVEPHDTGNPAFMTATFELEIGNLFMREEHPEKAVLHFERGAELQSSLGLPCVYNCGYAFHLLNDPRAEEYFGRSVELFEGRDTQQLTPISAANHFQAISHAYVALGSADKAREALLRALELAKSLSMRSAIFSSIQYKEVKRDDFVKETIELLEKLPKSEGTRSDTE
jgi:tetratricopeptide (TPR) repeat protein